MRSTNAQPARDDLFARRFYRCKMSTQGSHDPFVCGFQSFVNYDGIFRDEGGYGYECFLPSVVLLAAHILRWEAGRTRVSSSGMTAPRTPKNSPKMPRMAESVNLEGSSGVFLSKSTRFNPEERGKFAHLKLDLVIVWCHTSPSAARSVCDLRILNRAGQGSLGRTNQRGFDRETPNV